MIVINICVEFTCLPLMYREADYVYVCVCVCVCVCVRVCVCIAVPQHCAAGTQVTKCN